MASSSRLTNKQINVLVVGINNIEEECGLISVREELIKKAGGDNVSVRTVKTIEDAVEEHDQEMASYDLIIFILDQEGGLKILSELKGKLHLESMIVGLMPKQGQDNVRKDWIHAGADDCLEKPLTDEKMRSVFTKLRKEMIKGSIKNINITENLISTNSIFF